MGQKFTKIIYEYIILYCGTIHSSNTTQKMFYSLYKHFKLYFEPRSSLQNFKIGIQIEAPLYDFNPCINHTDTVNFLRILFQDQKKIMEQLLFS